MVNDVVEAAKDCNLLFLEFIASKETKDMYTVFANNVTLTDRYDPDRYIGKVLAESPDAYLRIIWKLRKSDIVVKLVDKTVQDEKAENDFSYDAISDEMLEDLVATGDFEKFYQQADQNVALIAREIRTRDKIVARQVVEYVNRIQKNDPDSAIRAILVQGLLHESGPHIKMFLPEAQIETIYFNTDLNDLMHNLPSNRLTKSKLDHPADKILAEDADRALLLFLDLGIYVLEHKDHPVDQRTVMTATNFRKQFTFNFMVKNQKKFDNLTAKQMHALAVKRIADFKAALSNYDKNH